MPNTAGESNNSKPASPQGFGTVSLSNDESEEHMEESVNSEDSSEYQPSLQRTFVNNAMMRDNDDHLIEEDDNMYGANNMDHHQSFNMSGGNQGNFNLHKSTSGNGAPGSSTGSSSTSNPAAAHLSKAAKKRRRFTPEEDKKIKEGIAKHKKDNNIDWDGVAKYACLERTKEQIKSRFMRMRKDEGEPAAQQGVASSSGVSSNNNNNSNNNGGASSSKDNNNIINGQNSADKYSNTATNTNNNNQLTIPSSVSSSITESSTYQSNQPQSLPPQTSPVIYLAPPNSNNTSSTLNCNKQENSLSIEGEELTEPSNKKQKTLPQMFQSLQAGSSKKSQSNMASSSNQNSNSLYIDASNNSNSFMMSYNSNSSMGSSAINNTGVQSNIEAYQQQIAKLQLELEQVKEQLKQKDKSLENSESKTKGYESEISQMKNAIHDFDIKNTERNKRFREIAVQFLRERAERERIEDKKRVNEKSITIGTITYQKGLDVYEVWQDGTLFQQLKENENRITTEKDKLEKQKKNIQKQRQQLKKEQSITNGDIEFLRKIEEQLHDLNEQEETVKLKLIHLKKEETQNIAEQENLLIEKSIQIREIKRIRDQEKSMFKNYPIIGHQKYIPTTPDGPGTPQINGQQPQPSNHHEYFLMKMLGKGGFSEVYKAYDLTDFKVVACKIHQLNPNWKEHRKENYIKHVLRECQINQSINHEKLIKMYDTFVFDNNTFVTVLEYCEGADLDLYIKKHQRVPEREAKNIIAQIFSGLNYLCQQKQRVIHYDLKPANILFDKDGNIKITDFGLSKIMDEEESIELTSQGAGTYWYLPPECFYNPSGEGPPPKISNKVDVWSAGVIFFQMLYGTKPFGNNLSQQKILSEGTIVNATQVGFPDKPTVSEEAKEFIRRCLTHEMSKRPDVKTLYNDSYLRGTSAPSSSSGTTSKSKKREKEAPQPSSTPTSSTNFLSFQQ